MTWYLRSMGDHDTHHGELGAEGTVAASCGVRFTPLPLPYSRVSLPGYPQDRDQVCPACDTRRREAARDAGRGPHWTTPRTCCRSRATTLRESSRPGAAVFPYMMPTAPTSR
ncbi:MAG: hypothetical protein JO364_11670 [Pseudonocardiales bacterium]|nr:hypothetical protein [Pseudonocardiales bacterium]